MLAVQLSLVRDVVRRADDASAMAAFEAALVVRSSVDRHLQQAQHSKILAAIKNLIACVHQRLPFQLDKQSCCIQRTSLGCQRKHWRLCLRSAVHHERNKMSKLIKKQQMIQ